MSEETKSENETEESEPFVIRDNTISGVSGAVYVTPGSDFVCKDNRVVPGESVEEGREG